MTALLLGGADSGFEVTGIVERVEDTQGNYPAYVFYHTDYSSSRKELIKRDMAFSSSEEQIMAIFEAEIADNIKKGWEEIV